MYPVETVPVEQPDSSYPASLRIDYPEQSNRLTVFFRLFTSIPILILWAMLFGGSGGPESGENGSVVLVGIGLVVVPTLLMILFRRKYPRWWFDWNLNFSKSRF